jgi:hypothetical protein
MPQYPLQPGWCNVSDGVLVFYIFECKCHEDLELTWLDYRISRLVFCVALYWQTGNKYEYLYKYDLYLLVTWSLLDRNANTIAHQQTARCAKGTRCEIRQEQQLANEFVEDTTLTIRNIEIEKVDTFKYLGRPLSAKSNEVPAINQNLREANKTWGLIRNLLKREGSDIKTSSTFYKTIVQSTLLYGAETWDTPADTLHPIEHSHNYVAWHLTNRHIRKIPNTELWVYDKISSISSSKLFPLFL